MFGEGVQNYMNDALWMWPLRCTSATQPALRRQEASGDRVVTFLDHTWTEKFSTSVGYSMIDVGNTILQPANSFERGHYGILNLMYYPVKT